MQINKATQITDKSATDGGFTVFQQKWESIRESDQLGQIKFRRVVRNGRDELQIEVEVDLVGKKRTQRVMHTFVLTGKDAGELVNIIQNPSIVD